MTGQTSGEPPDGAAPETPPGSSPKISRAISSAPPPGRRRPGRLRRWLLRPFVWGLVALVLLAVGLYELAQSRFARERVLALAIARTSEFLHRQVTIGSAEYSLFPWADIVLHDVRIPGPHAGDPPLATAELVHIALPWGKLRDRIVELERIDVVRPRLHLIFNPDGTSNLPQLGSRGPSGPRRFDVRIGRLLVQDGDFELNQRRVQLSLDARAIWGRMVGSGHRLDGLTTAQEVALDLPGAKEYRASVSGKGSLLLDRGRFEIAAARVAGPDLKAQAKGTISWRRGPHVDIQFDAEGLSRLANRLGYVADPLGGSFAISQGRVLVDPGSGSSWSFAGALSSPEVSFREWTVAGLAAQVDGRPRGVTVAVRRAGYGGGTIDGKVFVDLAAPALRGRPVSLDFNVKDVAVESVLTDEKAPLHGLSGAASGRFVYRCSSSAPLAGSGRADVRVAARSAASGLPVDAQGTLALAGGNLTSKDIRVTAPNQAATAELAVDLGRRSGRLDVHLDTGDAPAVLRLIPQQAPRGEPPPFWLPTAGHGHAEGRLAFAPNSWSFGLGLDLAGATSPALAAPAAVRGALTLTPAAVEGLAIDLTRSDSGSGAAGGSSLHVAGRVPFEGPNGRLRPGDQITLTVDANAWPAGEVARFLTPDAPVLGGAVSGHVSLAGTSERLTGRAEAASADLSVAGYALGRTTAAVAFAGTAITVERADLDLPAGRVHAAGSFDLASKAFSASLDAPSLALAREPFASLVSGDLGAAEGTLAVAGDASGTLDRPRANLTVRGRGLAVAGRRVGEAGDAAFEAHWDGGKVEAKGELPGLATVSGGGRLDRRGADLALDVQSSNLPGLARLAAGQPLPAFTGGLAGRVALAADFHARRYDASLALQDLHAELQGRRIQNVEPVVLALEPGRLAIRSLYLREATHDTELFANGAIGLKAGAPLDLRLQSSIWIGWLKLLRPDLDVDGFVDALATVRGTVAKPELNGEAVLRGARLVVPGFPHAFENVRGEILFSRDEVAIDQRLLADVAGGTVGLAGSLRLPAPGRKLSYQAHVTADDVSVRYPEGFLTRGAADVLLTSAGEGEGGGRLIAGRITLDRAYYLNDVRVGTLELLQRLFSRQRVEVAAPLPFLTSTQLNLVVAGTDALRVRNNVADVRGTVDLTVRGSLARPVVFGRVELAPNGKLTYAGNDYRIERGLLTFSNPYKIDPVIDLVAKTEVQSYEITLALSGTVDRLDAHFSSNANLADLEILALLATGQELPQDRAGADLSTSPINTQQTNLGAQGFLYGQAASAISQRVGTLFGLDRFRINPVANQAGQSVSGVGITVGKRLSKDVFVTYSSDPTATPPEVLQIQWKLSPKFTLLLTQTGGRSYAVDGQWERRF